MIELLEALIPFAPKMTKEARELLMGEMEKVDVGKRGEA